MFRVTVHRNNRPRSHQDHWRVTVTDGAILTVHRFRTEDEAKDFALIVMVRRQLIEQYLEKGRA